MQKDTLETPNIFRLIRIARDKKVKEIADELLVTPAYIYAIENGEKYPSRRLLRDYAAVLNIDEEIITTFIDTKPETAESKNNKNHNLVFERTLLALLQKICEN